MPANSLTRAAPRRIYTPMSCVESEHSCSDYRWTTDGSAVHQNLRQPKRLVPFGGTGNENVTNNHSGDSRFLASCD